MTAPTSGDDGFPVLTLRVSRDSGRTWGPERVVRTRDPLPPLLTSTWPPCMCPRCRERNTLR